MRITRTQHSRPPRDDGDNEATTLMTGHMTTAALPPQWHIGSRSDCWLCLALDTGGREHNDDRVTPRFRLITVKEPIPIHIRHHLRFWQVSSGHWIIAPRKKTIRLATVLFRLGKVSVFAIAKWNLLYPLHDGICYKETAMLSCYLIYHV